MAVSRCKIEMAFHQNIIMNMRLYNAAVAMRESSCALNPDEKPLSSLDEFIAICLDSTHENEPTEVSPVRLVFCNGITIEIANFPVRCDAPRRCAHTKIKCSDECSRVGHEPHVQHRFTICEGCDKQYVNYIFAYHLVSSNVILINLSWYYGQDLHLREAIHIFDAAPFTDPDLGTRSSQGPDLGTRSSQGPELMQKPIYENETIALQDIFEEIPISITQSYFTAMSVAKYEKKCHIFPSDFPSSPAIVLPRSSVTDYCALAFDLAERIVIPFSDVGENLVSAIEKCFKKLAARSCQGESYCNLPSGLSTDDLVKYFEILAHLGIAHRA